ncbi:TobH protein [Mycobacterium avium]|uniref:TobH protein n=1 Tax=Mycobacterium avium TaxID=1764 RepID=UPI001CC7B819|nr:TobH protein [Mycobacterium avium]MBZ4560471.1 TobH protein [Mycobacterium avium subsp. hominissuis]
MNATRAIDLEDTEGLLSADRDGLLRAASSAGAQVRAIATAVEEGALEPLRVEDRPRSVIWVAGRGTAETAGVHRGARVVVVAPYEGPLRDSTAGRAAVLAPRLWVPDEFGLCRYLAAGLAVVHAVDPRPSVDLGLLADELDAEALRNSAGRELFTNPAKLLAARIADRQVALAGDSAATLALARHGSSVLLRVANQVTPATGLADAVVAMRAAVPRALEDPDAALFHDEQIDGPLPPRLRVLAVVLAAEQTVVAARTAGLDDVYLLAAEDVPDGPGGSAGSGVSPALGGPGRTEQQLAVLAVRLEMAAVYMRLVRG